MDHRIAGAEQVCSENACWKEVNLAVVLFLVLTTISGVVTTNTSQSVVFWVRGIVAALLVFHIVMLTLRLGISRFQLVVVFVFWVLAAYALIRALMLRTFDLGVTNFAQDSLVIVIGLLAFGYLARPNEVRGSFASIFLFYAVAVFFGTVFLGGFVAELPPRFVFEFSANELNRSVEQTYSLGVSRFFGFAGVVAAFCVACEWKSLPTRALGVGLCLVFLFLSFMGGGRGEAIIAAIFILMILMKSRLGVAGVGLAAIGAFLLLLPNLAGTYEDLLFVRRLARLFDGDLSSRDVLFQLAVSLLRDQFSCLAVGCGVGFFQQHYGFNFALHPHNFVLEFLIVFGLPVFLVVVGLVVTGFLFYCKQVGKLDFFIVCYAYHFMVGMKSGYLFGSWIVVVLSLYFAGLTFSRLRSVAS